MPASLTSKHPSIGSPGPVAGSIFVVGFQECDYGSPLGFICRFFHGKWTISRNCPFSMENGQLRAQLSIENGQFRPCCPFFIYRKYSEWAGGCVVVCGAYNDRIYESPPGSIHSKEGLPKKRSVVYIYIYISIDLDPEKPVLFFDLYSIWYIYIYLEWTLADPLYNSVRNPQNVVIEVLIKPRVCFQRQSDQGCEGCWGRGWIWEGFLQDYT